jgi:murein DD-endopeptidase MepM/ murein hydrolase activator NlpD
VAVPPVVAQGDPFLVRVRAEGASQVVAAFDGREAPLFRVDGERFAGILSAGLETHPGEQPVHLSIIDGGGNVRTEQLWMKIHSGGYPEEQINLPPDRLDLLDQTQSEAEMVRLREVWAPASPEKLWDGVWSPPVTGTVASRFGTLRDYNAGSLFSRHDGIDLRGGTGTPVMAPARGRVVFAEPLEVRGNCVWLDHGWGVYTGYFHLSEIGVEMGQELQRGEIIGKVGATGRTTAPHLHWEVRALGAAVHPVQWMLREIGAVP